MLPPPHQPPFPPSPPALAVIKGERRERDKGSGWVAHPRCWGNLMQSQRLMLEITILCQPAVCHRLRDQDLMYLFIYFCGSRTIDTFFPAVKEDVAHNPDSQNEIQFHMMAQSHLRHSIGSCTDGKFKSNKERHVSKNPFFSFQT